MILTIASTDQSHLLRVGSMSITDDINSRNTSSFLLRSSTGFRPDIGQNIVISENSVTVFAGTIDEITETREVEAYGTQQNEYQVQCVDYNQICDRHYVARVYANQTLKQIVENIVLLDLTGESITTTAVEDGPTIERAVFNWQTVAECFNELADLTGYAWNIDYTKDLHFFARESNMAPFSLTDTSNNFRSVRVQSTREKYRNKQIVRAGTDITNARTEHFTGDDTLQTFLLQFQVATTPTITLDTVAQTVGIRAVDIGKQWYYAKGEKEISHDDSLGAMSSTQDLAVTYQGSFPFIMVATKDEEVADRISIEGGTGIYEDVDDSPNIDTSNLAIERANGLLRRFGSIPQWVEFETDTAGLFSGQLLDITITTHDISGQYLIDSVNISDVSGQFLRYNVRALDGESQGSWTEFFRKLVSSGRRFVIRENEVAGQVQSFIDNVNCADDFTASTAAPESRIGFALCGFSQIA
jgi:hypothetical protein